MENAESGATLRDALAANLDIVESGGDLNAPQPSIAPEQNTPGAEPPPGESAEQKTSRLANRVRDDQGRLLPGIKPEPSTAQPAIPAAPPAAAPAVAVVRPSSWKKDYWSDFDKIAAENPKLAQYLNQRESEFASGVSTYKQEAEQARPLNEAIAPFLPNLQRFGLEPTTAIRNLLGAHERLSLGSPQEKISLGVQIIKDYGIDPQALFQVLSGQAPMPQIPQQQQPAPPPVDVGAEVRKVLIAEKVDQAYQQFLADVPTKYPHYEQVKDDMAGLLQIGKAQDYESAYHKAVRLHDDLWEAEQQRKTQEAEQQRLAANKANVNRARANAVSVKSDTPVSTVAAAKPNSSLRDKIAENLDAFGSNRV